MLKRHPHIWNYELCATATEERIAAHCTAPSTLAPVTTLCLGSVPSIFHTSMPPPRRRVGTSLRFSNPCSVASTILLVALALFGRTARGFVARTPVVAVGASTGASETQGKYSSRETATNPAGHVIAVRESKGRALTKVSMVGGNDDNRSVEEEWPFHKSRYASRVSLCRCANSKIGPYLATTLSSKRSLGQKLSLQIIWVVWLCRGRGVRCVLEASPGPCVIRYIMCRQSSLRVHPVDRCS